MGLFVGEKLLFNNGNGACPTGTSVLDIDREADHAETEWWKLFQMIQLFHMAVDALGTGLVTFPNE